MTMRLSVVSTLLSTSLILSAATVPAMAATSQQPVAVGNQQNSTILFTPKSTNVSAREYEAKITIPVISGLADRAFEAQLNAQLQKYAEDSLKNTQIQSKEDAALSEKEGWELRPHALDISYQVIRTGKLLSFAVSTYTYTGGAHGYTDVTYYNIANLEQAKRLKLSDLFQSGYDYKYVINNLIKQQIADTEKRTEEELPYWFESITDDQAFSFNNGNLVLHFGQYEIAPYAAGMPSFVIPVHRYQNLLKADIRDLLK